MVYTVYIDEVFAVNMACLLYTSSILELSEEPVRKKVEKRSSREIIKTNVDKETGDKIRALKLDGVKVDEDYKRYYPMGSLASKVLGFTGGDNQGIIGLEVMYEKYLKGKNGVIPVSYTHLIRELTRQPGDLPSLTEAITGWSIFLSSIWLRFCGKN